MIPDLTIATYSLYLGISLFITYWVGKSLYRKGAVYLQEMLPHSPDLVQPLNKVLLTGYYLINIGYVFVLMMYDYQLLLVSESLELLTSKLSIVLLTLGSIHYFNLFIFLLLHKYNILK